MRTTTRGNILTLVTDNGRVPQIHVERTDTRPVADGRFLVLDIFDIIVENDAPLTESELRLVQQRIADNSGRIVRATEQQIGIEAPPGMPRLSEDNRRLLRRVAAGVVRERN